jgi:hypothetical protein
MKTILVVGQKFSSLTEYLLDHGYEYIFLQDVAKTKFPDKKFKRRVLADFSNDDVLFQSVDAVGKPIDGVMTTYENYVVPSAKIAQYLGLPGLPLSAAQACTDKFIMRGLFAKSPQKISPDFALADSEEVLRDFAKKHQFPIILKPANLSKSLLVTKNNSLAELIDNFRKAKQAISSIYVKYAPGRQPKLIVEEYLDGHIHSVDAFIDKYGQPQVLENVVDYQTGYDIGFDDNFHYSRILPSALSLAEVEAVRNCAAAGIKALGMKNSPAHCEIIVTKDGPRIVEIGARNGGYRERMHRLANGIDITRAAINTALGQPVNILPKKNQPCAVLELFPRRPGIFNGINNLEALKTLPSLNYLSIKAKLGDFIGKAGDGYKMAAVIILHNQDITLFNNDLNFVNNQVSIETSKQ